MPSPPTGQDDPQRRPALTAVLDGNSGGRCRIRGDTPAPRRPGTLAVTPLLPPVERTPKAVVPSASARDSIRSPVPNACREHRRIRCWPIRFQCFSVAGQPSNYPRVNQAFQTNVTRRPAVRPGCGAGAPVPAERQAEKRVRGQRRAPCCSAEAQCRKGPGRLIAGLCSNRAQPALEERFRPQALPDGWSKAVRPSCRVVPLPVLP